MSTLTDPPRAASAPLLVRDMPAHERPREYLAQNGAERCATSQLLAILLRTGTRGHNVMRVAEDLLARFQSLEALSRATIKELCQVGGVGRDKAVTLQAAFQLATRIAREKRSGQPLLDTPESVAELMRDENAAYEHEQFQVLLLNSRRRLLRVEKLSQGTIDAVVIHPRDVFRPAIAANAASVILIHNHPSGDPQPSEADIRITRDLIRIGKLIRIEVADHIILGRPAADRPEDFKSLRAMGYFFD
jgi:DNA repair protein RadC